MTFNVAVIGLGYVGLPLAVELGKQFPTVGFDIDNERISALHKGSDVTLEISAEEISAAKQLRFTAKADEISAANIYIITVPTPIDNGNNPNLTPIKEATTVVANYLGKGDVVIYESTVYPGATEEVCVPILRQISGLTYNEEFFCGYSPERINPGDKTRSLTSIVKVTSGSTPDTAELVDQLYQSIISAGTYKVSSIKVAEASKVIENTQRDINIALMNELAHIFSRIGIDTEEVLEAAGTKWNFLPFRPGLVGGHCIGVDPYYLAHKAETLGYHPQLIAAGRRINDKMGSFVVSEVLKLMAKKRLSIVGANVLIMGLSFKENCPDLRNTRVIGMVEELESYNANVEVYDPWVNVDDLKNEQQLKVIKQPTKGSYDAIIIAVSHDQFKALGVNSVRAFGKPNHVLYDIKYLFASNETDGRL